MEWSDCFPSGSRVLALPSWQRPRLYFSEQKPLRRWADSALYPAFRSLARGYRLFLRAKAMAGFSRSRTVQSDQWLIGEFIGDLLPPVGSVTVLVGTPGPAQKVTIQLRDLQGEVIAYVKYAETETAKQRLEHEYRVLSHLPAGVGPKPLKFGAIGDTVGLLTAAAAGTLLAATLPPPGTIEVFLNSLIVSDPIPADSHPWIRMIAADSKTGEELLRPLMSRHWPIAIHHGDLAPWNLIASDENHLSAVDWEQGCLEGFPHLDLAHYLLQTAALVYRWSPGKAMRFAIAYLARAPWPGLAESAEAIVKLSAFSSHRDSQGNGIGADDLLQKWRQSIWEGGR